MGAGTKVRNFFNSLGKPFGLDPDSVNAAYNYKKQLNAQMQDIPGLVDFSDPRVQMALQLQRSKSMRPSGIQQSFSSPRGSIIVPQLGTPPVKGS